ncbi:MAG: hypothetical protein RIC55_09625 [Pirellulaceae bacterium]
MTMTADLPTTDFADKLRQQTAAVRLSRSRFGARKTLDKEQKAEAARVFGAEAENLSASKRLIDTRHEKYKAVTSLLNQAATYWKDNTLPWTEEGVRLVNRDKVEAMEAKFVSLRAELDQAVAALDEAYWELREKARHDLGDLFNRDDYPSSIAGQFAINWDYPSVEPPDYLRRINPKLYEQEEARIKARFSQAVDLAETAFAEEFRKLVEHLTQRLTSRNEEGEFVQFKDSTVTNLRAFFERFKELNIGSNESLDGLIERAQEIVGGIEPDWLRSSAQLRNSIANRMSAVGTQLDALLVNRRKRAINLDD